MTKINSGSLLIVLMLLGAACNLSFTKHEKEPKEKMVDSNGFAVIELFTSEGCSSCPAADALLAKISDEYEGSFFVLGFHVDYWNRLGWTDAYSSAAYSSRQQKYGQLFHLNSIYTPQAVVNGKAEIVGSDEGRLRENIVTALGNKPAQTIELKAKVIDDKSISVTYNLDKSSNEILNIALVQLHTETDVKRGENEGRILKHINIVRDFKTIGISGQPQGSIGLNIPAGLSAKGFKVIAYAQDVDTFEVKAVTETLLQ
ncbi:MAG: DUF1223 domain-containing protein [Panacibacter sp.]